MSRRGRRRNVGVVRVAGGGARGPSERARERESKSEVGCPVEEEEEEEDEEGRREGEREGENSRGVGAHGAPPRCLVSGSVCASHRHSFALLLAPDLLGHVLVYIIACPPIAS